MHQLPGENKTASPASANCVRSTPLSNEQSGNRSAIGRVYQHAGNNSVVLETSDNNGDVLASTTRSGKKRKREDDLQMPLESATLLPFACLYLKHAPATYGQKRGCRGSSFKTIHRLKEHLKRTHKQSPHCIRCWRTFKTKKDLNNHQRSADRCEVNEEVPIEGFNQDQWDELSKRSLPGAKSEEDKWRHIYKILFPDCDKIPDPFYHPIIVQTALAGLAPGSQRETRLQFTQEIPSHLEADICVLMKDTLGVDLSSTRRRKLLDGLKGLGVTISWQPHERVAAGQGSKSSKGKASEEEATGNSESSEREPSSAESTLDTQSTEATQPIAMPAIYTSAVVFEGSSDTAPPMFGTHLPSFGIEGSGMGESIYFGNWGLHNSTSWDWANGGHHTTGLSLEGHAGSSNAQSFDNFGAQTDDGVNTESADLFPFTDNHLSCMDFYQ